MCSAAFRSFSTASVFRECTPQSMRMLKGSPSSRSKVSRKQSPRPARYMRMRTLMAGTGLRLLGTAAAVQDGEGLARRGAKIGLAQAGVQPMAGEADLTVQATGSIDAFLDAVPELQ